MRKTLVKTTTKTTIENQIKMFKIVWTGFDVGVRRFCKSWKT